MEKTRPYHDDGIGKGYSGELGCSQMSNHDVVGKLYQDLACLCYHYRKGDFQVSPVEWYVIF